MIPPQANAAFAAKREDALETDAKPCDSSRTVVCVDEAGERLIGDVREPLPVRPGSPAKEDSVCERGGVADLRAEARPVAERRGDGVERPGEAVLGSADSGLGETPQGVAAWQQKRNSAVAKVVWQFTNTNARIKLKKI